MAEADAFPFESLTSDASIPQGICKGRPLDMKRSIAAICLLLLTVFRGIANAVKQDGEHNHEKEYRRNKINGHV